MIFLLVIPIILFIILYFSISAITNLMVQEYEKLPGRQSHFSLICSVMMTARLGKRRIKCRVPGMGGALEIVFRENKARIVLPLTTKALRERKDELVELFESLNEYVDPLWEGKELTELSTRIGGTPEKTSAMLIGLYQKIFGVGPKRAVSFELETHQDDFAKIKMAWEAQESGTLQELPVAKTASEAKKQSPDHQKLLRNGLASVFLFPIPFILTFYIYDLRTAAIVLLIMSAVFTGRRIFLGTGSFVEYFRSRTLVENIRLFPWPITPVCAGLALYMDDLQILQIIPTAYCLLVGSCFLYETVIGPKAFSNVKVPTVKSRLVNGTVLLLFGIGLAVNEHLRHNSSEELWVWYYAYLRLELLFGSLFTVVPAIIYRAVRDEKNYPADNGSGDTQSK